MKTRGLLFIFFLQAAFLNAAKGQTENDSLYNEIKRLDSTLFNAFNTRDINLFKSLFAEDLEFYHDKGGLTGYNQTVSSLVEAAKSTNQLRRDLVKESLEVYPIPGYGAMQIGTHRFCHWENNRQDCGAFKFVHIWQKKNGEWKITRVVSYDH